MSDVKGRESVLDENSFGNGEIVNYLTAAAICVGNGPGVTNGTNKQIIKSLCRPLTVPK